MVAVRTVHVVFKTHLDIGFTGLARDVKRAYVEEFIPGAIALARSLVAAGGPERFVWTTGAWLIADYLDTAEAAGRAELNEAIRAGHVAWHALPFTTHSEMMDAGLFRQGLSIAAQLDAIYGRSTIAAKMTDVPGHTIGIVPILSAAGIRYLHIGTNPGSATPKVPETFVWRAPDGSEVVVSYASTYGSDDAHALEVEGLDQALHVSLTGDNHGPPTAERIREIFSSLAVRYPGAEVRASRLDDFAAPLWELRDQLPVLTDEIGDTWIHGIASDPTLVRNFRALQHLRGELVDSHELTPGTAEHDRYARRLLMVPEHTWGMDLKRFLPDYVNYRKRDFAAARSRDLIDPNINPVELADVVAQSEPDANGTFTFSAYEESWQEQRDYLDDAITALSPERSGRAQQLIDDLRPRYRHATGAFLDVGRTYALGRFAVVFSDDGSINSLVDRQGHRVADPEHPLGAYRYVTYDAEDYEGWFAAYHENMAVNASWVVADFGKPGMRSAEPRHATYRPVVESIRSEHDGDVNVVLVDLHNPAEGTELLGAPRRLQLRYKFSAKKDAVDVELAWFNKDAYRLPEASWFTFAPLVRDPHLWTLDKLGTEISPLAVVARGNRNLHAVGSGMHYRGPDLSMDLLTLDAPVVAPGSPRLLVFDDTPPDLRGGFHVNLHNNVWGTNFRMWYDEDAFFRFRLTLHPSAA